jgi:hypothetical protein
MSAMSTPASVPKVEVKEKKPRTPTLPAKFGKFIHFGYWFMQKLNEDPDAPAVDETLFIEKLNLFADVDSQKTFVQDFFDQSKDVNKNIRQLVKDRNKEALKAAKAQAKPKKEPKEKKPRAKKEKTVSNEDSFVNEIVQLANGTNTTTPNDKPKKDTKEKSVKETKEKSVKEKPVKETKEKSVKETKEKPVKDTKDKSVKETKEKPLKDTKDKPVKLTKDKPVKLTKDKNLNQSDLTQVSVLNLNDQQFLIDDDLNVYHFSNHSLIGKFDPSILTII